MRLRKIEELLLAFHQSHASDAAGAYGNKRLNDVKAAPLWIGPWIDKRQHAVTPPSYAKEQEVEERGRSQQRVSEIAQFRPGNKQNHKRYSHTNHCRAKIRLLHD